MQEYIATASSSSPLLYRASKRINLSTNRNKHANARRLGVGVGDSSASPELPDKTRVNPVRFEMTSKSMLSQLRTYPAQRLAETLL
jgi:hypothetical protein